MRGRVDFVQLAERAEQVFLRWAHLGLNQGPPACEAGALPLSYAPGKGSRLADLGVQPAVRQGRSLWYRPDPVRLRVDGLKPQAPLPLADFRPLIESELFRC